MAPVKPIFREAFQFWLKLGFISFGGPAGQIAIMHEFLVDKKKWISDSRFLHGLNYCMILPGPEAQQLATYIGWLLHGVRGGLAAGILFILPSVFILLALSVAYVLFGNVPWVAAIFYGLKPAVIAIVVVALVKIGKKSLQSNVHYLVALLSFILIFFAKISFPLIIVGALVAGFILQRYFPQVLLRKRSALNHNEDDEHSYYLNKHSPAIRHGDSLKRVILQILLGFTLWFIPYLLFFFRGDSQFWLTLINFFTKAAFVTFGGAYAVLPYVAQVSVEKFNWLNEYQMIDGLALGESTPGPLIMVLVFVGFMAGYNQTGSILDGTLGLLATTYYTFLPCFLLIFIGAPFVERSKDDERSKTILSIVTAAVVGVILNLTIYLGKAVLFPAGFYTPDWFAIGWLLLSFIALYKYKVNMMVWIGVSALAGICYHLLT